MRPHTPTPVGVLPDYDTMLRVAQTGFESREFAALHRRITTVGESARTRGDTTGVDQAAAASKYLLTAGLDQEVRRYWQDWSPSA